MQNKNLPWIILGAAVIISASMVYLGNKMSSVGVVEKPINQQKNTAGNQQNKKVELISASIDDDAMIGNKDAPVTIIEFSDFECPYCSRFVKNTYPEIKSKYINTGKVRLIFRDFPLSFHGETARRAANYASCAREQGGDEAYFQMHDIWFGNTQGNGKGIDETTLKNLITSKTQLNLAQLEACVKADKYKDEMDKDESDGKKYGISGTPSFIVGKTQTGSKIIKGELLVGAQPFSEFDRVIQKYLK